MFADSFDHPNWVCHVAPARTTDEATANTPVGSQYLDVPQPEEHLQIRTRRPPIDGALSESEANTNYVRPMTPAPVRLAASRHVGIPQPEGLPRKTPSPPVPVDWYAICNDQPTNQKQGHSSRSRAPSPYPTSRGRATTCLTPSTIITKSQPSLRPRSEGQWHFFPQFEVADKPSSSSSSCNRSRDPSPSPGPRGHQETRTDRRLSSSSPKPESRRHHRQVSFPEPGELPHRTLPPLRHTNQKQSKSNSSTSSSSSSSSSPSERSRAPSPYPLRRAPRKEILQEFEASRTDHRDGIHHSTTTGLKDAQGAPATPDRAALPFMNPQPSLVGLCSSNTRDAATPTEDGQMQQPKQQQEQQPSFQEFWDSFEGFNEHRYYPEGETRPEYKVNDTTTTSASESAPEKQQDISKAWETFEDLDIGQVPQGRYDAESTESTESRRQGGWFSRWFGSGGRR